MATYNNDTLELLAVSKVNQVLSVIEGFAPSISTADKEPTWDGNLYVYNGPQNKKSDFIGRIPLQVKGKTVKKIEEDIHYPVAVDDLRNMLIDGGCIYFVVGIKEKESVIYFYLLAPQEIKRILKKANSHKTIKIKFSRMPLSEEDLRPIIMDFLNDCRKQKSFVSRPTMTLKDAIAQKKPISVEFWVDKSQVVNLWNLPVELTKRNLFLYSNQNVGLDSPLQVPIEGGSKQIVLYRYIPIPVYVNGRKFFNGFKSKIDNGEISIVFGENMCFPLMKPGKSDSVSEKVALELSSFLPNRITEIEFLIAIQNGGSIELEDKSFTIFTEKDEDQVSFLTSSLHYFKRLDETLRKLGVKSTLNLSSISPIANQLCTHIIDNVLDKVPFSFPGIDHKLMKIKLGNLNICLLFLEDGKHNTNVCSIKDYFSGGIITYENNPHHYFSSFTYLLQVEIFDYDNIPYEDIPYSYELFYRYNNSLDLINRDLLSMLNIYDKMDKASKKAQSLITSLFELSKWMVKTNSDKDLECIYQINMFQVKKRIGVLDDKDQKSLSDYTVQKEIELPIKAASFLLLDNMREFESIFELMDDATKTDFKSYPIYSFYKKDSV